MKDMTVSKALKWIFIASILNLFPIVSIVGFILNLLALYGAGKLQKGYNTAFTLSIAGIVVSVIDAFVGKGVFGSLVSIVSTVISLAILYFVITTTNGLLSDGELIAKGEKVWKINLICTVAAVVLTLLAFIPLLAGFLAIIVFIVEIVATVLYLIYLYNSSKALA